MSDTGLHDPKQPPRLQSLDLAALGVSADGAALACDIDDPDCEVPALPVSSRPAEHTNPADRPEHAGRTDDPRA